MRKPLKPLRQNSSGVSSIKKSQNFLRHSSVPSYSSKRGDLADPEDAEIERLEKLLHLKDGKHNKKKLALKLNKEYELYEGIGGNFGDFLMKLDSISELSQRTSDATDGASVSFLGDSDEENENEVEEIHGKIRLLDEDEQEVSDIDASKDEEEGNDSESEESDGSGEQGMESGHAQGAMNEGSAETPSSTADTYRPVRGEDIYGRIVDPTLVPARPGGAYVPPGKRTLVASLDESSTSVSIRTSINGLMNRLSDQSRDFVVKSLKTIFQSNSVTLCSNALKDCILGVCANNTQNMSNFIPTYSSVLAALHLCVGRDVGAFVLEHVVNSLVSSIDDTRQSDSNIADHSLIASKQPLNYLLIVLYLYNLRVVHHNLVIDITKFIAGCFSSTKESYLSRHGDQEVELLVAIVDHAGFNLRTDDPMGLKDIIAHVSKLYQGNNAVSSRTVFMIEALTDLKNNKSRRTQAENKETVTALRKWLGHIKMTLGGASSGDATLNIGLQDFLDAETKGRWWKAGASWLGHQQKRQQLHEIESSHDNKKSDICSKTVASGETEEERVLLALAEKMKFHTATRKSIFLVVMSSRDLDDAYERLMRLELKGKADREIVRVLFECCAQEKVFNQFYAELVAALCKNNRQTKMTVQFTFWDYFKVLLDQGSDSQRRVINSAKLLAHLVCVIAVPLSVIKTIDVTTMNESHVLFLSTLLAALLKAKISTEDFQMILDRIATTKDFAVARDNVTFILQKHLKVLPECIDQEELAQMKQRRKLTLRTMEAMNVLNYSSALQEEENVGGEIDRESQGKKRRRSNSENFDF